MMLVILFVFFSGVLMIMWKVVHGIPFPQVQVIFKQSGLPGLGRHPSQQ